MYVNKTQKLQFLETEQNSASYEKQILGVLFLKLGFTPYKAEKPLQGMELQEKEA